MNALEDEGWHPALELWEEPEGPMRGLNAVECYGATSEAPRVIRYFSSATDSG